MHRRDFLAATGALFLCGCARGPSSWSEVPWVAGRPAGVPPTTPPAAPLPGPSVVRAPAGSPVVPGHVEPNACDVPTVKPPRPAACALPPPMPKAWREPARRAAAWTLVTREEWGAGCLRANHDPMGTITRITVHHTDEHAGMRGRPDREVVRSIQRYHQDHQGWADIGYHYLVGTDGRIYEGRPASVQGAHAGGANNKGNLGISVIGNFSTALPARRQLEALAAFLDDRRRVLRIPSSALHGHRDLCPTECPGGALYRWLQDVPRRGRA